MSPTLLPAQQYASYLDVNLQDKLQPIHQSIDDMLLRLDEFQTMVAMVQQERGTALGLTGSLTLADLTELKSLCRRIDAVDALVDHAKSDVSALEGQMNDAERQHRLTDTSFKSLLRPLFAPVVAKPVEPRSRRFDTKDYFD